MSLVEILKATPVVLAVWVALAVIAAGAHSELRRFHQRRYARARLRAQGRDVLAEALRAAPTRNGSRW